MCQDHKNYIFFNFKVLKAERPDVDEKRSDLLKLQGKLKKKHSAVITCITKCVCDFLSYLHIIEKED